MKIKSTIAFICFISVWCLQTIADTSRVTALLEALEKTVPAAYRDPGALVEKSNWSKEPDFRELQSLIARDWASHAPAISTVAPSNNAKTIYYKAAQVLDRSTYLKLIMATSDRMAAGELHPMQFKWVVYPQSKHLREIWHEDPPSIELKKVAARVREVMAGDPSTVRFMNEVISGQVAANHRDFHPEANPLPKPRPTQAAPSDSTSTAIPPPAPASAAPAVATTRTPAEPPAAQATDPLWMIVAAIAVLAGMVLVLRHKKPKP